MRTDGSGFGRGVPLGGVSGDDSSVGEDSCNSIEAEFSERSGRSENAPGEDDDDSFCCSSPEGLPEKRSSSSNVSRKPQRRRPRVSLYTISMFYDHKTQQFRGIFPGEAYGELKHASMMQNDEVGAGLGVASGSGVLLGTLHSTAPAPNPRNSHQGEEAIDIPVPPSSPLSLDPYTA